MEAWPGVAIVMRLHAGQRIWTTFETPPPMTTGSVAALTTGAGFAAGGACATTGAAYAA